MRDHLKQLRVFCETARFQSMSKAADSLSLTQPAVSRQIRVLEEEFSAVLFERRGPKISLSPAGRKLYELALPLVDAVDLLPEAFAQEAKGTVSGRVRIAAGLTGALFVLPEYLETFRSRYPGVRVRVDTAGGAAAMQAIRDHEVDFGVGALEIAPKDLEFRKVMSSDHVLIVPPGHALEKKEAVSVEDVAAHSWVLPVPGTYTRVAAETVAQYVGAEFKVAVEAAGWSVMKRYVAAGLGIAVVPELCVTERDGVSTVPFDDRIAAYIRPRQYGVILRRNANLPPAARHFVRIMVPGFGEDDGTQAGG